MENNDATINDVLEAVNDMSAKMDDRFDKVEGRLDKVEGRLDKVEGRLDNLEVDIKYVKSNIVTKDYLDRKFQEHKEDYHSHQIRQPWGLKQEN